MLKDPIISGESLYYHAASEEMKGVSGKFFNLTIDEIPAKHALNKEKTKKIWNLSIEMTGLDNSLLKGE
jgi:hypothetical protein